MSRNEFLKKLREVLSESLDKESVNAQIDYYDNYISDEVTKGRSEKEVIDELGDPRLIAKTIKTVNGKSDTISESYEEKTYEEKSRDTGKGKTYVYSTGGIGCVIAGLVFFILLMLVLRLLGFVLVGTSGLLFGFGPFGIMMMLIIFWLLTRRQ